MTIPYRGGARTPGPLGLSPVLSGGRLPGPLGYRNVVVAQAAVTKVVVKATTMPPPSTTSTTMEARAVAWPLGKDKAALRDVRQGELATCPIAAILAALAYTASGRKRIADLLEEHTDSVTTTLTGETMKRFKRDDPDDRPQPNVVASKRYFSVKAWSPAVEVSDVFYVEYSDNTAYVDPVYMQAMPESPDKAKTAAEVLWPAVIEKAYAQKVGSYEVLDDYTSAKATTVDVYWTTIVGSRPQTIPMDGSTDLATIRNAATAAERRPTIGASRKPSTDPKAKPMSVTDQHGYAVLGMKGSRVRLYDPQGQSIDITLEQFRADFAMILHGP